MDDDDDIQIISINWQPTEVTCALCGAPLTKKSESERQLHYEDHFDSSQDQSAADTSMVIDLSSSTDSIRGGSPFATLKSKRSAKKIEASEDIQTPLNKQNIFWHNLYDAPPPSNFTPDLIPILRQALLTSHSKGRTVRAALCYSGTVHVFSEWWDRGWGCTYRNFLMACTALMVQQVQPDYFPALDQPSPPGVRNLQQWIEDAWQRGVDPAGAEELEHKLVGGTKWIGTAELHIAFRSRGIPTLLVDFPKVDSSAIAVLNWIVKYFSEPSHDARAMKLQAKVQTTVDEALRAASPVVNTDRMPLILQHKGHSRMILGYERTKEGSINLLCFDPSRRIPPTIRTAALQRFLSLRPRRDLSSTNHRHRISASKIINTFLHPRSHKEREMSVDSAANSKKRCSDETVGCQKRVRGGQNAPGRSSAVNMEVIEISDDDEHVEPSGNIPKPTAPEIDYAKVLEHFRLRPKKVGKNNKYQILYFPLEDLLPDAERWAQKVVTTDEVVL